MGDHPEAFFLATDRERVFPVFFGGETRVIPWGAGRGSQLPQALWIRQETLDAGDLAGLEPEEVAIRASRAVDNGVRFDISHGILAVMVRDELGTPIIYPLVEAANRYYQGKTGSEWMPCLL